MDIEKFIEKHGKIINTMVVVSWNTRQTFEQLEEIWQDGGDDIAGITEEIFLEYMRANATDYIDNTLQEGGQIALEREVLVVNESGEEVE